MITRIIGFGSIITAGLVLPLLAEEHANAKKILSIGGSVTEMVYALGQEDRLIARDTTSTYPEEAQELPDVGYIRALSPEGVLSVKPDLIIAEEGAGPPETIEVLRSAGIPFETIPAGIDAEGLIAKFKAVAEVLGVADDAEKPLENLQADFAALTDATKTVTNTKRVLFILSLQGGRIMAAGQETEADAMIRLAGAENALQGIEGYKPLTDEAISAAAPDIILMMDRGDAESDHAANSDALAAIPALATTPAIANNAVVRMDGLYLLGFGPRTAQAAQDLHDAIYESE